MRSLNPRVERLKELLGLEERRASVQEELDSITARMHSLRDSLLGGSAADRPTPAPTVRSGAPRGRKAGRMQRGALKEQVLAALEAAGEAGVRVTHLAEALVTKPGNIHSWFHSSLKRFPQIKKLKGGHYRLVGKIDAEASARKAGRPAAPGRPAKAATKQTTVPGSRRGALSEKVLTQLEKAGAKGISVREIADNIGANYRNINVWFATTGKKNAKVKKVAPAIYRLSA